MDEELEKEYNNCKEDTLKSVSIKYNIVEDMKNLYTAKIKWLQKRIDKGETSLSVQRDLLENRLEKLCIELRELDEKELIMRYEEHWNLLHSGLVDETLRMTVSDKFQWIVDMLASRGMSLMNTIQKHKFDHPHEPTTQQGEEISSLRARLNKIDNLLTLNDKRRNQM